MECNKSIILKTLLIWLICSIITLYTCKELRSDKKVTIGTGLFLVVFAPIGAPIGLVLYITSSDVWDKCLLGCVNETQ